MGVCSSCAFFVILCGITIITIRLIEDDVCKTLRSKVKVHSKDELHQWDELKQNQRANPEDLLEQHWNPRGDTFSQSEGYSLAGEETSRSGETLLLTPHWAHNSTGLFGTKDQKVENRNGGISGATSAENVDIDAGNKVEEGGDGLLLNRTEGRANEATQSPSQQEDKSKFPNSHTGGSFQTVTQNPQYKLTPTEATGDRVGNMFRPTKEPNPEPRELGRRRDNETPEETSSLQVDQKKAEQEREELLLLHKRLDQEKEILRQQETKADDQLHGKPHHHLHTTQTPGKRHHRMLKDNTSNTRVKLFLVTIWNPFCGSNIVDNHATPPSSSKAPTSSPPKEKNEEESQTD